MGVAKAQEKSPRSASWRAFQVWMPRKPRRASATNQYSFLGSCMLRTRLRWRFTAAAFLRLRSAVGFS